MSGSHPHRGALVRAHWRTEQESHSRLERRHGDDEHPVGAPVRDVALADQEGFYSPNARDSTKYLFAGSELMLLSMIDGSTPSFIAIQLRITMRFSRTAVSTSR